MTDQISSSDVNVSFWWSDAAEGLTSGGPPARMGTASDLYLEPLPEEQLDD